MPPVTGTFVMMNDVRMNEGCHATQGLLALVMRWMHSGANGSTVTLMEMICCYEVTSLWCSGQVTTCQACHLDFSLAGTDFLLPHHHHCQAP